MHATVMIVEDDRSQRQQLSLILEANGCSPLAAADAPEALRIARKQQPQAALIDIKLGDSSGLQVLRELKVLSPDTECILITGFASQETAVEALQLGAYSYLQKPYDVDFLLLTIRRALEKRAAAIALRQSAADWEATFNAISDWVCLLDREQRVIRSNRASGDLVGLTAEELLGSNPAHLIPDLDLPPSISPFQRMLKSKQPETHELRRGSQARWFTIKVDPVWDRRGEIGGAVQIVRDVTRNKLAEEELRRSYQRLSLQHRIAELTLASRPAAEIAETVARELLEIIPSEIMSINLLVPEEDRRLRILGLPQDHPYFQDRPSEDPRQFRKFLDSLPISGKPYLQTIEGRDDLLDWEQRLLSFGQQAYVVFPLIADEIAFGSLIIANPSVEAFNGEQLALLTDLSAWLAIAFQQSRQADSIRAGRQRLKHLSQRLLSSQESERRRIALELHDDIGQTLSALKITMQTISVDPGNPANQELLTQSISMIESSSAVVRDLALDLRPSLLDDLGLAAALRWFTVRAARLGEIEIELFIEEETARASTEIETACFRVAQEAITNSLKHASPSHLQVALSSSGETISLSIADNGVGFDVPEAMQRALQGNSLGLLGMRERVEFNGGELEITSNPREGTQVIARFPTGERAIIERRQHQRNAL